MASKATESLATVLEGIAHRVASREANELRAARRLDPETGERILVEFACECARVDCERSIKVPLYVYRRVLAAGNQYLLQAGHHAFTSYRTIMTAGLMRIEERV
jgi:hypothetical protein